MRAGGCTVQQTLTPEAATVVRNAVALARRRGHAQATPLHVAATLLASDSSLLRRACLQSHGGGATGAGASHPLQCRALELCFNVALNRLPAAVHGQPSLSNALIAALKRAQAHQRRGCIEQQQAQPLLAVKVEMEQLVLSILDDPSVSRVMREAGFYSTHVKSNVESSLGGSNPGPLSSIIRFNEEITPSRIPLPWITHQQHIPNPPRPAAAPADVKSLMEALLSHKRRNTVIVGEDAVYAENVVRELAVRLEAGDVPEPLKSVQFLTPHIFSSLPFGRDEADRKLAELHTIVSNCCCQRGAIVYVGDLRWTLQKRQDYGSCYYAYSYSPVEQVVMEVGRMVGCYGERLWLLGIATYQTYMRCNMRQPPLESQWELQTITVPAGGLGLSLHSSAIAQDGKAEGGEFYASKSTTAFDKLKSSTSDEDMDKLNCCQDCSANFELESRYLVKHNNPLSPLSAESQATSNNLPIWLRQSKKDQATEVPSSSEMVRDLRKKWNQKCRQIHQQRNQMPTELHGVQFSCIWNMGRNTIFQDSKLQQQSPINSSIPPNFSWTFAVQNPSGPQCPNWSVMGSPTENSTINFLENASESDQNRSKLEVETALALGMSSSSDLLPNRKQNRPSHARPWWQTAPNSPESMSASVGNDSSDRNTDKCHGNLRKFDKENLRWLCKALDEKVKWRSKVTQAIATTVLQCRSGVVTRQDGSSLKGIAWLLFLGPDRIGKRKMARALAEIVYGSHENFASLEMGNQRLQDLTSLESLKENICRRPHSVIVVEDIDQADISTRKALASAMETGKLLDSDLNLSDVIIIMTSTLGSKCLVDEERLKKTRMRFTVLYQGGKPSTSKYSCSRFGVRVSIIDCKKMDDTEVGIKSPFKRKADWGMEESSIPPMHSNNWDNRQAATLDLNYSARENEAYGDPCYDGNCSTDDLRVLRCAQEYLSHSFLRFIDKTVVFGQWNSGESTGCLLNELNSAFLRNTGGKGWLEIDKSVMDHFVIAMSYSEADQIFSKWVNDVFVDGLVKLLSLYEIREETGIRLIAEESMDPKSFYPNSCLPTKIDVCSPLF